ncbi:MAG: hypothetical protein M3O32_07775 [Actinomycetota bacterium]|nr:hypothetical protein [Actinomycetota bacterium]
MEPRVHRSGEGRPRPNRRPRQLSPRLRDAAAAGVLDADDAATLTECFEWLTRFRWRTRLASSEAANAAPDVVSLSALAPQDRAALRGVAREIVGISRKLGYLSTFR